MSHGVVLLLRVHGGRQRFVGEELEGSERYGHGECRRVRDVERAETFVLVDIFGTIDHRSIHSARVLDLHALLNDCDGSTVSISSGNSCDLGKVIIPSKGFMKASLTIVAAAPLEAVMLH